MYLTGIFPTGRGNICSHPPLAEQKRSREVTKEQTANLYVAISGAT